MRTYLSRVKYVKARLIPKVNSFINTSFSDRYLLYTNVALSGLLSGLGDIIMQNYDILSNDLQNWDKIRTRNMSVCGVTIGVLCHYWYNYLDHRLPGYTIGIVFKKIIIDQLVCSPACIATLFLTSAILEGRSKKELVQEAREKAWMLYAADWAVWPIAQFINFYFLSTRYRVLYDNSISLGYDVYTSYVKHKKTDNENS